jgi:hypothetical protein
MGGHAIVQLTFLLIIILFLLGVAISFAVRPSERKLGMLRPLSLALVFALVGALCGGLANTFQAAVSSSAGAEAGKAAEILLAGIAEALVPGAVGFAVLAIAWGLAAIGLRRLVP